MENINMQVNDGILTITIDLSKPGTLSGSGKSMVIASTRGNVKIPGKDINLGLNLYRKV